MAYSHPKLQGEAIAVVLVAQSCPTLWNSMDCSQPGSSVHGILQARVLDLGCHFLLRGSSPPRDWTHISCIGRWILYLWATREAPKVGNLGNTWFLQLQQWEVGKEKMTVSNCQPHNPKPQASPRVMVLCVDRGMFHHCGSSGERQADFL